MPATTTVRALRNHFPRVKQLVEAEGEVVVTDRGTPRYRLTLYTSAKQQKSPPAKDYMTRLRRYQPRPLGAAAAKALHDENRGDR
jgi:antitoxin (DNA-binding transcriptional repressor) of toxin-antitoxin stability system